MNKFLSAMILLLSPAVIISSDFSNKQKKVVVSPELSPIGVDTVSGVRADFVRCGVPGKIPISPIRSVGVSDCQSAKAEEDAFDVKDVLYAIEDGRSYDMQNALRSVALSSKDFNDCGKALLFYADRHDYSEGVARSIIMALTARGFQQYHVHPREIQVLEKKRISKEMLEDLMRRDRAGDKEAFRVGWSCKLVPAADNSYAVIAGLLNEKENRR